MSEEIIKKVKIHFKEIFNNKDKNRDVSPYLVRHVSEVEKWSEKILKDYPEADRETVLISVWLHDIGRVIGEENIDHAVNSETEARRFLLAMEMGPGKVEKVAHAVRSHRCNDIQPETLEAKILAAADSASHMTDIDYILMFQYVSKDGVIAKLERDYRDIGLFPELRKEITPLYRAWKNLLQVYLV